MCGQCRLIVARRWRERPECETKESYERTELSTYFFTIGCVIFLCVCVECAITCSCFSRTMSLQCHASVCVAHTLTFFEFCLEADPTAEPVLNDLAMTLAV